ncbi:MAG TPA: hypothetical protein PKE26_15990 [Kiritimatiellia bacterium]|nr:hypothetical protein [Kiritimatiellia bacterium]HMP00598.1 hypothetical protein [Kiritimatiellia bacterium]HMP98092.1 hypothetical protein [Kiritimatiellia bacterium]
MKIPYRVAAVLAVWLLAGGNGGEAVAQGNPATVQALMIQAQNDSAPMDRRLERVEFRLRRVFGFQFYRYLGEGSISLPPGGEGAIRLPDGHRLQIRLGGKGKAEVRWFRGDEALLSTSVGLSRDAPIVLGGIPANGGKIIIVLTEQ